MHTYQLYVLSIVLITAMPIYNMEPQEKKLKPDTHLIMYANPTEGSFGLLPREIQAHHLHYLDAKSLLTFLSTNKALRTRWLLKPFVIDTLICHNQKKTKKYPLIAAESIRYTLRPMAFFCDVAATAAESSVISYNLTESLSNTIRQWQREWTIKNILPTLQKTKPTITIEMITNVNVCSGIDAFEIPPHLIVNITEEQYTTAHKIELVKKQDGTYAHVLPICHCVTLH